MRVLYLSQYAYPEVGATQARVSAMARHLVAAGHEVTLITEFPNHPHGIIPSDYKGKMWTRTRWHGIDVIRVRVYARAHKTFINRIGFYLSYMVMAVWSGLTLVRGRYDVMYATSPPLFVGAAALCIRLLRRIPLVFEVRNLWPEAAVSLGELRHPLAIRIATRLEDACCRKARKVIAVAEQIRAKLFARGVAGGKLCIIRNGSDPGLFRFCPAARARIRKAYGVEDGFLVVYAGLMGVAQDLSTLLAAAKRLQDASKPFRFLLIGDGPDRERLMAGAATLGLANTTFLRSRPASVIFYYLSAGDAVVVPLKPDAPPDTCTCKMYDAMACARPVILCAAPTEGGEILKEADAGMVVPAGDTEALTDAISALAEDEALRKRYGEKGRDAILRHYDRRAQAAALESVLVEASCR